jgi:hypothetical protein
MTEFTSCLSSLVFGRTRAGPCFLFQESPDRADLEGALTTYAYHPFLSNAISTDEPALQA